MTAATDRVCGNCGVPLLHDSRWCTACGTPATSTTSTPSSHAGVVMVGVAGGPVALPIVADPFGRPISESSSTGFGASSPTPAPGPTPAAGPDYASVGKRFGALVIDGLCQGVVLAIVYAAAAAGLGTAVVYGLFVVLTLGFLVLLIIMAGAGSSPGKKLLGITVVRAGDGSRPGLGRGFGRLLLRGLMLGVTLYIAGFSPWWDSSRRKRAWWDAAVDTVVIDGVKVLAPQPVSTSVAPRSSLTWSDTPMAPRGIPSRPDERTVEIKPEETVIRTSWNSAPPPSSGGVITGIPGGPTAAAPQPAAPQPAALPQVQHVPVEHTRLADRRSGIVEPAVQRPLQSKTWSLLMDNGEILALAGPMLIGRDPAVESGEQAALKPLGDETRSVSKTHLRVEPGVDGVMVTDRHSTNGVAIVTAGDAVACPPGEPTHAPGGSTVRFGDREFRVQ